LKEVKTEPIVIALAVDDADLADRLAAMLAGGRVSVSPRRESGPTSS